jgi:hypothetical protein
MENRRVTPPSLVVFTIVLGSLFVLGGFVTAVSPSARALWVACAVSFVGLGIYAVRLVVRSNDLVRQLDETESELSATRSADSSLRVRLTRVLREPLTSIVGLTDRMLNDGSLTAEDTRAMLTEIRSGAREVEAVLGDLPTDDRDTRDLGVPRGVVLLDEEFASVVAMTRSAAEFRADLAPSRAWGDSAVVRQILRTIVATAVSSDCTEIDITTEQNSRTALATLSSRSELLAPPTIGALTGNSERTDESDPRFVALKEANEAAARMGGSISYAQALGRNHIIIEFQAVEMGDVALQRPTPKPRAIGGEPSRDPESSLAASAGGPSEPPHGAIRFP